MSPLSKNEYPAIGRQPACKLSRLRRARTHHLVLIIAAQVDRAVRAVPIDRPASLRVAQDALMVDEWLRTLISRKVELDQDALDVVEVSLERVEESAGLKVFRRCASTSRSKHQRCPRVASKKTYTEIPSSLMMYPMP